MDKDIHNTQLQYEVNFLIVETYPLAPSCQLFIGPGAQPLAFDNGPKIAHPMTFGISPINISYQLKDTAPANIEIPVLVPMIIPCPT
jgi:hypothetical protein